MDADGLGRFPADVEATVYFCTLEALQNIAKYAAADRTVIRLARANGSLSFEVEDDGLGFDPTAVGSGSGLQGMADRLAAVGGSRRPLGARSGTVVAGQVPITARIAADDGATDRRRATWEMRSDARASRGRLLAFRIVGWLLGVATIGLYLPFVIISFVSDDPSQTVHRFHVVGSFFGIVLIGVFSIVFVMRPDWIAVWHVLVAQALAYLFGGLMGGDLISGFWITGVVGLILLGVFAPDRRALLRLPGHPSVALLTYALLCSIPAWIYAVMNAELQRLGSPSDPHVELHHWSGWRSPRSRSREPRSRRRSGERAGGSRTR